MKRICKSLLTLTFAIIPVLCLTVTAANALWCAIAVFVSLMLACSVRLLGEKIIPANVKNICIIIVIALGISLVEIFTEGLLSADPAAAAFMPLCAVPTLLLLGLTSSAVGAKKTFFSALKNGGRFVALLLAIGAIRELVGTGCLFGLKITRSFLSPVAVLTLPAGAIFIIALCIAVLQHIAKEDEADA